MKTARFLLRSMYQCRLWKKCPVVKASIKRQHRSVSRSRERQDCSVFDTLAGLAGLVCRKHGMAKLAQALHNGITEILVHV
jgi:hypothetical protein